jgi:hypothetical protein
VANVVAFRDIDNHFEDEYDGYVGAERQPFFSEVLAQFTEEKVAHPEDTQNPTHTIQKWTITVELFNPWPGDNHLTNSLNLAQMEIPGFSPDIDEKSMAPKSCKFTPAVDAVVTQTFEVDRTAGESVNDKLGDVALKLNVNDIIIDSIPKAKMVEVAKTASENEAGGYMARMYRNFGVEEEKRGKNDSAPIPVVFIYDWQPPEAAQGNPGKAGGGGPDDEQSITTENNTGIPIRIMNSVPDNYSPPLDSGGLPIRKIADSDDFKAFARLGEINRVLCAYGLVSNNWWPHEADEEKKPWVLKVTDSTAKEEELKFNWLTYPLAANILCVGGPWNDGLDNDGDGKPDFYDTGKPGAGQTGGPEFRVAGKININTAIDETLDAFGSGVGVNGLKIAVRTLRGDTGAGGNVNPTIPIRSPAEILANNSMKTLFAGTTQDDAKGALELRDLAFTRLSNIATIRSDTFSVYGTVQIVDPTTAVNGVIPDTPPPRTRRFWALVDRSPSLAYPPTSTNFIYPRILNFQWLD